MTGEVEKIDKQSIDGSGLLAGGTGKGAPALSATLCAVRHERFVDFATRRRRSHEKEVSDMGAEWNRFIDNALLRISIIATAFGLWLATLFVVLGL